MSSSDFILSPDPVYWRAKLQKAAAHGDTTLVLMLMQEAETIDPDNFFTGTQNALQNAAGQGRTDIVRVLLETHPNLAKVNPQSRALLHAVKRKRSPIIRILLENGANPDFRDKYQRTIIFAAASNLHIETLELLLTFGANVNARDIDGRNVLMYIAAHDGATRLPALSGDTKLFEKLLNVLSEAGIDLEAKDDTHRTALHWAAVSGKAELVRLLARLGANLNVINDKGVTPLHLASDRYHSGVVEVLRIHGVDLNPANDGGWTALHISAERGHEDLVYLFLRCGVDINAETKLGETPLHRAAANGHLAVTKLLLGWPNVRRDTTDAVGNTPLVQAAQNHHSAIVQLLSSSTDGSHLSESAMRACKEYKAAIVNIYPEKTERGKYASVTRSSVFDLLYGRDTSSGRPLISTVVEDQKAKRIKTQQLEPPFRWIHLPANNVAWAEALLTKYFIERGSEDVDGLKAVANSLNQQHQGTNMLSRFMKPTCQLTSSAAPAHVPEDNVIPSLEGARQPEAGTTVHTSTPTGALQQNATINSVEARAGPGGRENQLEGKDRPGKKQRAKKPRVPQHIRTMSEDGIGGSPQQVGRKKKPTRSQRLPRPLRNSDTDSAHSDRVRPGRAETTPLAKRQEDVKPPKREGIIAFFMPYLHFEFDKNRIDMQTVIKDELKFKLYRSPLRTNELLSKEEHLIHGYLFSSPPLHLRRTLDQYYYYAIDTGAHLIVTCFPQRWNQQKADSFDVLEGIIEDVHRSSKLRPVSSVYELASVITNRCSGLFYEDRHDEDYHFLDMFESSIGDLVNKEPELTSKFNSASMSATKWLKTLSTRSREKIPEFADELMDIHDEMEVLAEARDVRNELQMLASVLRTQLSILPQLHTATSEHASLRARKKDLRVTFDNQQVNIQGHLSNIQRMDQSTSELIDIVNPLLDLKQKYASVFEARFARQQATTAARQSQTVMVFTIVTIIFLPMSFMAAFFAINISELPRGHDGSQQMHLSFVSKYTFGIGLAVSLTLIIAAFAMHHVISIFSSIFTPIRRVFLPDKPQSSSPAEALGISGGSLDSLADREGIPINDSRSEIFAAPRIRAQPSWNINAANDPRARGPNFRLRDDNRSVRDSLEMVEMRRGGERDMV